MAIPSLARAHDEKRSAFVHIDELGMTAPRASLGTGDLDGTNAAVDELLLGWSIYQLYGAEAFQITGAMDTSLTKTLPERVAELLLALSEDAGGIIAGLRFQTVADFLGSERETIGAILRALHRQGIIELGYRAVHITNAGALRELAGLDL